MRAPEDRVNILMVDDHPAKLLSYQAILADLGENLITATTGKQALEYLLRLDVAVVLMDVSMPEMGGFELAEMIAQHPRFARTAIIFISAVHLTDMDRIRGYQRGAVDYISVPVVPDLLRAKVSIFAELHRKTHQLESLNRELELRVAERTEELEQKAATLQLLNQELLHRNQELDAIIQTAPDMIFSSQAGGSRDYLSVRFNEYTGAPRGAELGFGWLKYVHPEDIAAVRVSWRKAEEASGRYESEYRIRGIDGQYRWFRARAVPIRDEKGRVVKWYGAASDVHDSKLLEQSMRDNAAVLETMVNERTAALRTLSGRLMTMQDDERRRIARDLHDGLGQELVAAKMLLDTNLRTSNSPAILEATQTIDRAIQQIRSISHLLHPPLLDEVGLISAVRWYLDGLTQRSGLRTSLEIEPEEFPRLVPELETAVFRIIQEALTNVFRHSQASNVAVSLTGHPDHVLVRVQDDGKGISPETIEMKPGTVGVGIAGMTQRAREFGGEMRLMNTDPGTIVEVMIPSRVPTSRDGATELVESRRTSA